MTRSSQYVLNFFPLILLSHVLVACSSVPPTNEKIFEQSRRITIEFSNASLEQRHLDRVVSMKFEKGKVLEAAEVLQKFSNKNSQTAHGEIAEFIVWIKEIKKPGNYKFQKTFPGFRSFISFILEKKDGIICCDKNEDSWPTSDLDIAKPSKEQLKELNSWSIDKSKYKKYFMTVKGERIWPVLSMTDDSQLYE